jgi:hypothetical protein
VRNDNGTRRSSAETQLQPDGSIVATTSNWTYDATQRLTGETVSDTGTTATPQGLATAFTLPGDYNLDGTSDISLTWNAGANAYLMAGMTPEQIGDTSDGVDTAALLAPSAAVAYGGNGSDWVLVVTDPQGDLAAQSFTEANGAFSPDAVVASGSFSGTPSFTVPTVAGFYSDSFNYDLASNRSQENGSETD